MLPIFAFVMGAAAVAAPSISSLNYSLVDIAGGGQSLVVTGVNMAGVTSGTIFGATVSPSATTTTTATFTVPAHAAGAGTVSVTGPGGTSNTLPIEYWSPAQITGISAYLDANKGVTASAGAVGTWLDQSSNARSFTQATGANKPTQVGGVFGTLPSIRMTPQQFVSLAAAVSMSTGTSCFAVAKWTATTAVTPPPGNPGNVPLTILGDRTGGYGSFGAKGGAIESNHYVGGPYLVDRGASLNDSNARLIGATYNAPGPNVDTKIYVGATQQGATDSSASAISGPNTYDTIGAGYGGDGWSGDLGAVVIVAGVIAAGDLTKLNTWSQQRWGTP